MIGGCAAVAIAGNVFAADEDYSYFNPYASLKGGYAFLGKRNDIKYKGGFAGAVELGVSYDSWRLGFEMGYKSNKIKNFKLPGGWQGTNYILNGAEHYNDDAGAAAAAAGTIDGYSIFKADGAVYGLADDTMGLRDVTYVEFKKLSALSGMLNICYDYAMTDAWSIYAGVGLGVARVNLEVLQKRDLTTRAVGANGADLPMATDADKQAIRDAAVKVLNSKDVLNAMRKNASTTELSKTVFAWQLMAGVGYEFNENWKLTLGYKLFNTAKVKQTFAGKEYKIKMPFNHTAEVGLTYTF